MIHIVSVYKDEWYEKGQALEKEHPVYRLYSRENTEYEFNLPLVWHEDAYQDEVSKLLMKEIGGAVWSGEYEIKRTGKCEVIHNLPFICKLGLVILRFGQGKNIMLRFRTEAVPLWEWLSEHLEELQLVVLRRNLDEFQSVKCEIEADGKIYGEDKRELAEIAAKAREEETPLRLNKKTADESWKKEFKDRTIRFRKTREMSLTEFAALCFDGKEVWNESAQKKEMESYRVLFHCRKIVRILANIETGEHAAVLSLIWKEGGWKPEKLLLPDEDCSFQSALKAVMQMGTNISLIVRWQEDDIETILLEPQNVLLGLMVDTGEKTLEILEVTDAVRKFREKFH